MAEGVLLDKREGMWVMLVGALLTLIRTPYSEDKDRGDVVAYVKRLYPRAVIREVSEANTVTFGS